MVHRNHAPVEAPVTVSIANTSHYFHETRIKCMTCAQEWPCPAIVQLREWQKVVADRYATLGERAPRPEEREWLKDG